MMMVLPWRLQWLKVVFNRHALTERWGWPWSVLLLAYCVLIFWLSSQPMLPMPDLGLEWQDKVVHASAYALMALLFWRTGRTSVKEEFLSRPVLALCTLLFCVLYGASDEWHQSFVAGRDASLYDWMADVIGISISIFILWKKEVIV